MFVLNIHNRGHGKDTPLENTKPEMQYNCVQYISAYYPEHTTVCSMLQYTCTVYYYISGDICAQTQTDIKKFCIKHKEDGILVKLCCYATLSLDVNANHMINFRIFICLILLLETYRFSMYATVFFIASLQ